MKKITILSGILLVAFATSNCEKDDICDQETTPRLIMHFYDAANPTIEKNVTNLLATGVGATALAISVNAAPEIALPLKTTEDATSYSLVLNSNNTAIDNEDRITFNYIRTNVYVSRACGYKTVFTLDPVTPFVYTDGGDAPWIQNLTVNQSNVLNENEVHISIYF